MLQVSNLYKRFGPVQAVSGASFHVQAKEAFGLLGPNGAGKSTTISMVYSGLMLGRFLFAVKGWL